MKTFLISLAETYFLAFIGGSLFYICSLPIPWILGPMTTIIIWKSWSKRRVLMPRPVYNGGLITLGIYFGLSFTASTFTTVIPYIIPYILTTILLLSISIISSLLVCKLINVDPITSVFGSIPGGLSEMVAASESLKANTAMVTIFQTVRLLTVVFLVPFLVIKFFPSYPTEDTFTTSMQNSQSSFNYLWFILPVLTGYAIRNVVPAAYVMGPLAITALLNIIGVSLPYVPSLFLIIAQVTVGVSMGSRISLADLKIGGKYCGFYFVLTLVIIATSFGIGYLFTMFSDLTLSTAILSLAPGGLVEMVLTATSIGADPAVVSSLQLIRILFIIIFVPTTLKWIFTKKKKTPLVNRA